MNLISARAFLAWASTKGIGVDPKYAETWPRNLSFRSESTDSRYWVEPNNPGGIIRLHQAMIKELGPWKEIYLWPKSSSWIEEKEEDDNPVWRSAIALLRPVWDGEGALRFGSDEYDTLQNVMFSVAIFSWSWVDDIYLIPDNGKTILMMDHHNTVFAKFDSGQNCTAYIEAMRLAKFELPTKPPDETFKPAPWMKSS